MTILADLSPTCPTRALFLVSILARMSVRDARVYTCNLSCTRLQNYTIGASLMSVSVSVSEFQSIDWQVARGSKMYDSGHRI